MVDVWEPHTKFRIWFEIEAHAADAMADVGMIPRDAADAIMAALDGDALREMDVARIDEIEAVTKHDVIAFLTYVSAKIGAAARFLHHGITTSDVPHTFTAVQLARAADILIADLDELLAVLKRRAIEHKLTPTIGRSHGIHAEPVTFGLKMAEAFAEFDR